MNEKNNLNELRLTRVFNAPVKAVWEAWTDTKQVAQWWGPRGFSITTHSKDLRTGGHWAYTMHGPDGVNYENKTLYLEVSKYERLVYDHGGNDDRPPLFRVTVSFTENKGKTKMEMIMALATPEAANETRKFIKKVGGNSTWDRLAEFLEKSSQGKEKFFINRTFEVPIHKMFEMWTDPKHFAKWMGPKGSEMHFFRSDIREGGTTFYSMSSGDLTMYGRTKYLSIKSPNQLVYTQQFVDKDENISRHPLAPVWPESMLTAISFSEEGPNSTRVTIEWEPYEDFTKEELEVFIAARGGMTQGWNGTFEKLEDYLKVDSF